MLTPVMVESVRTIPITVDCVNSHGDCDSDYDNLDMDDTGFPFDADDFENYRPRRRHSRDAADGSGASGQPRPRDDDDAHFRSTFDDLAKRHPEFAEHLEGFPFRSGSFGNNNNSHQQHAHTRSSPRTDEEFRRFGRPFGSSRFERFGFPASSSSAFDPFEEQQQQQAPQAEAPPPPPPQQPQAQAQQPQEEEVSQSAERGRGQQQKQSPIQPSNTVDLGQKQEPVDSGRGQRSMSAPPPDNRQRFVSSINIPIGGAGMGEDKMGGQQSQQPPQQPQQQQQQQRPTERVIPIHVEGRDEPVLPKNANFTPTPQQQQQPPQQHQQGERIFGQRPAQFTQYVPKQQATPTPPPPPQTTHQPPPAQATPPPPLPQQQQAPPPESQPHPSTPIDMIQSIQKDVSKLMSDVEQFAGQPKDKQYRYLDEMLTRNLINLDNIDTQGQENIRLARKEAVKCIEKCISLLEAKAAGNVLPQQPEAQAEDTKMEVVEEAKPEESADDKMEVQPEVASGSCEKAEAVDKVVAAIAEAQQKEAKEDSADKCDVVKESGSSKKKQGGKKKAAEDKK